MVAPTHGFHLPVWTACKKPMENQEAAGLVWWACPVLHGTMALGHLPLCISGSSGLQSVHLPVPRLHCKRRVKGVLSQVFVNKTIKA